MTNISPKQQVKQFGLTSVPNPKLGLDFQIMFDAKLLVKLRIVLVNETISCYQIASEMLKSKNYQK